MSPVVDWPGQLLKAVARTCEDAEVVVVIDCRGMLSTCSAIVWMVVANYVKKWIHKYHSSV